MRDCTACGKGQPINEFYVRRGKPSTQCKGCEKAKMAARYATDTIYRAKVAERATADYRAIRAAAIRIYGSRCAGCGGTDRLEFDHVHGGGERHRRAEGHRQFLRRVVVSGQPATDVEVQLLCKPCHSTKSVEAGEHSRGPAGRFV